MKLINLEHNNMTQEQQIGIFMKQLEDPTFFAGFMLLVLWIMIWKGIALWKASKNDSKPWFIALLLLNTFGILEITYIFYFSKKSKLANTDDK
jgi:hypothetical protein